MKLTQLLARQALHSRLENTLISKGSRDSSLYFYGHLIDRCTDRHLFRQGEQIHARLILLSATTNSFFASKLIRFYGKTNYLSAARNVFDQIPKKNTFNLNTLLITYSVHSLHTETLELFSKCLSQRDEFLDLRDVKPDARTLSCVVKSISEVAVEGPLWSRIIHCCVIKYGLDFDAVVGNGLVTCYSRCGDLVSARAFFDNMCSGDLVSCMVQNNQYDMVQYDMICSTIVSGYMLHGFIDEAMKIFEGLQNPGLSTWTALISGMVQNNQYDKILDLVRQMQVCGIKPNRVTLLSVLPAIPYVSHLGGAKEIHAYAIKIQSNWNIYVASSLIDIYAKLGFLSGAQRIFDQTEKRDVVVWTAIIAAYASHGDTKVTLRLFDEMLNSRTKPNALTFTNVLAACAHTGLVNEAWEIFHEAMPKCGIYPSDNHFRSMVVCLCRAKKISEAVKFVMDLPIVPTAPVWGALLAGASECGDIELAKFVSDYLFELHPTNPSYYVTMANLYAKVGRWEEAERIRDNMINTGLKKIPGSSRIEAYG